MVAGLNMIKQLDARVPAEFSGEFAQISETFLTPFTRLMKKIKGPAYRPPTFENIKSLSVEDITDHSQPIPHTVSAIPAHDVIDMTQPSQHVSQPPTSGASSSRPPKLASRRMAGEKWSITKSLSVDKKTQRADDWGWGNGNEVKLAGGITVFGHHISEIAMQSLDPGAWIDDRIIYSYMVFYSPTSSHMSYLMCIHGFHT